MHEGRKRCKDRLLNYKCVLYTLARGARTGGSRSRLVAALARRREGFRTELVQSTASRTKFLKQN